MGKGEGEMEVLYGKKCLFLIGKRVVEEGSEAVGLLAQKKAE